LASGKRQQNFCASSHNLNENSQTGITWIWRWRTVMSVLKNGSTQSSFYHKW
jgi:hypothetical protein